MKIAVLGSGTMGQMIARKMYVTGNKLIELCIANRTAEKAVLFCGQNPGMEAASGFAEAAKDASVIFLCVQPMACRDVLKEIQPSIAKDAHLISIAADVSISALEQMLGGKISRMMPTITTEVDKGVTLLSVNGRVTDADIASLRALFSPALDFSLVQEGQMNILSALTSCGPGLVAALLDQFTAAVCTAGNVDPILASDLLLKTVSGTAEMALRQRLSLREVYKKVATPGGITEKGASVLNDSLPAVYAQMLSVMERRHAERKTLVDGTFGFKKQGI